MIDKNDTVILKRLQLTARTIRNHLSSHLNKLGLYAGQDTILMLLSANDGQSPGWLAQQLSVKAPTITKSIARLCAQGFVTKQHSDIDQRQSCIFLTSAGREVIRQIENIIETTEHLALDGISQAELDALIGALNHIEFNTNTRLQHSEPTQEGQPMHAQQVF